MKEGEKHMSYEVLSEYLRPEMVVLAIVLYFMGTGLKKTNHVPDWTIPIILTGTGILLAALYILSTAATPGTYQEVIGMILDIIVQGVLCSAMSVYVNQFKKQITKKDPGVL